MLIIVSYLIVINQEGCRDLSSSVKDDDDCKGLPATGPRAVSLNSDPFCFSLETVLYSHFWWFSDLALINKVKEM